MRLYLIQRGTIYPDPKSTKRISELVNNDYMGSAEFEFGALPASLRRFEAKADTANLRELKNFNGEGKTLFVYSCFTDEEFASYSTLLLQLRQGKNDRLKESSKFEESKKNDKYNTTDFWWDINNEAMWTFRQDAGRMIGNCLAESLTYMNAVKDRR